MKFSWSVNRDTSLLRPGTPLLVLVLSCHIPTHAPDHIFRYTISHEAENKIHPSFDDLISPGIKVDEA